MRVKIIGYALAGLCVQSQAWAAWEIVPNLAMGAYATDNARLETDDDLANLNGTSANVSTQASVTLTTFSERGFLSFEPTLSNSTYADDIDDELETTDVYFAGSGAYNWLSVGTGFVTDYSRESILTAELLEVEPDDDPDVEDPDPTDTGRLSFINQDRERLMLRPFVDFKVSERNTLRLQGTRTEVSYSGSDLSSRTGYDNTRLSAGIIRNANLRNQLSATLSVDNYQANANQNDQDTVRIEGAFTRPVTQLWTLNLAAGVLRSDFSFVDSSRLVDNASTDFTLRLGMRKRAERSSINFDLTRDAYPNSSGFSIIRSEFRSYFARDMSPRLAMNIGVRLSQSESLDDVNSEDDRDYKRGELNFTWAIKPVLYLVAGYAYTAQEFTSEDVGPAASHGIYIGLGYQGMSRR